MSCTHLHEPLDWSGSGHWSPRRHPCYLCGAPTNMRNTAGKPAHKACVERALARIRRERATGQTRPQLYPVADDREAAS